jgi:hypothetical protein
MVASQIHANAGRACFGMPITLTHQASTTTYVHMLAARTRLGATVRESTCTSPINAGWLPGAPLPAEL